MMGEKCLLMALYVVLCTSVCLVRGGPLTFCDTDHWNYTQEVLVETNSWVYDIAVSHQTGNVYVALYWKNTLLVMKERNITENVHIADIYSVDVDRTLPDVYIGSNNGLYKYDEMTGILTSVTQIQHNAYRIFVHNNSPEVYVVRWPQQDVYRYRHNFTERTKINIDDKTYGFVVDNEDNYFYNNDSVTKIQLNGHNNTMTYDKLFKTLAVDNMGKVFGTTNYNGIHTVHRLKTDGTSQLVATLDLSPNCMSFDKDNNVVFGSLNDYKIIKLKFNKCISPSTTEPSNTTITRNDINTTYLNITNEMKKTASNFTSPVVTMNKTLDSNYIYLESRLNSIEKKLSELLVNSGHVTNYNETDHSDKDRAFFNFGTILLLNNSIHNYN